MQRLLKIIAYLIIANTLLIYSCSSNQFTDKIKALDSLSLEVERLLDSIKLEDTTYYINAAKNIDKNLKLIQKELKDTVTKDEAQILSDYKMIRKSLLNYPDKINAIYNELVYSKKQLNALSKDLSRGYIEASKAEEYFSMEVSSTQTVLEEGWSTLNNSPVYLKMFEEVHPKVLNFMEKHQISEANK